MNYFNIFENIIQSNLTNILTTFFYFIIVNIGANLNTVLFQSS